MDKHAATGPDYQILELPDQTTTPDPVALARRHYGLQELNPVTTEHIEQRMLDTGAVQVTLTLNNLKDDSVRAMRLQLQRAGIRPHANVTEFATG